MRFLGQADDELSDRVATKKAGPKGPASQKAEATSRDVSESRGDRWGTSYWVDETVPDLSELLLPHGVDAVKLTEWLGPKLGAFRGGQNYRTKMPTPRMAADVLASFRQHAQAISELLLSGIPPIAEAHLHYEALRRADVNWIEVSKRVRDDLLCLSAVAAVVENAARNAPVPRGRKKTVLRDKLLGEVVDWLATAMPKSTMRHELAAQVLSLCGVPTPSVAHKDGDTHAIEKAVRRGKKLP